jgi:hypothetical protein
MATAEKTLNPEQVSSIEQQLSRENTPDSPVVQELRRQVANAFVLYANYKHYHWQTYVRSFAIRTNCSITSQQTCSPRSTNSPSVSA